MGLILHARCGACGYDRADLRLGATHAQIDQHDICHHEVHASPCCRELQSVLLFLGAPLPEPPCARCGVAFVLAPERRYRISTMKGEVLTGHACPRCGARALSFERTSSFT